MPLLLTCNLGQWGRLFFLIFKQMEGQVVMTENCLLLLKKWSFPVFDIFLVKGDEPVKLPGFLLLCKLFKFLKMLLLSI